MPSDPHTHENGRLCAVCGVKIEHPRRRQRFCSDEHKFRWHRLYQAWLIIGTEHGFFEYEEQKERGDQ